MTGRVVVPTAEGDATSRAHSARSVHALALAGGLVLAVAAVPAIPFAASPAPVGRAAAVAAPLVDAPATDDTRWSAPIALPDDTRDVVGFGTTVVALTPDALWPAWAMFDGRWTKLRGIPRGPSFVSRVGVKRDHGFSIVGVVAGRTVIYDYRMDGEFEGARTVRDIDASAVAAVGDGVAIFDSNEPAGRLVTTTIADLTPPGTVVDAVGGMGWLLVLTTDGAVHGVQTAFGSTWRRLGEGFAALRASDVVVAVGADATVGLHRLEVDGTLVRMDGAPFGPTVAWGGTVAVHDWSSGSIWTSGEDDRWERLPLWTSAGFRAAFREMVPGTDMPTVVGADADGNTELWRAPPRGVRATERRLPPDRPADRPR